MSYILRVQKDTTVRVVFLVVAILVLVAAFVIYRSTRVQNPVKSMQFLMDTVVEQSLYGKNAQAASVQAEALLREMEGELSLYRSGSQIQAINAAAGKEPVVVSARTVELLLRSTEFGAASDGAFDITMAPLVALWRVTDENPQLPSQAAINERLPLIDYKSLVLNKAAQTAFLPRVGQALDLGGVAKGYAAGLCLEKYQQQGVSGYISIGGNVAVSGLGTNGKPLRFGIRAPRGEAGYIGSVELTNTVMATSGDYERYFEQNGVRYHHILNPRSGYPADGGYISVSVICRDGAVADFLSTALFVRGRAGLDSLMDRYDYEYVAVDNDLNIYVSQGLRESFQLNPDAGEYHLLS